MNDKQREYLIDQVDSIWNREKESVEKDTPERPSLNNYLIAAFLDNSIEFADINILKKKMRETVLKYGTSDKLIEEEDDGEYSYSYKRNRKKTVKYVKILAADIFIIPEAYQKALKEYDDKMAEINEKLEALNAQHRTVTTKIKLGSNGVLDKLIEEADNLASLSLVNSSLTLLPASTTSEKPKPKQLKNK